MRTRARKGLSSLKHTLKIEAGIEARSQAIVSPKNRANMKQIKDRHSGRKRKVKDVGELLEEDNTIWIVESILAKRVQDDGRVEYKVRWEGFPEERWDTWEPCENLMENCSTLVEEFEHVQYEGKKYADMFRTHCICNRVYRPQDGAMIQCQCCLEWLHLRCIKMSLEEMNSIKRFYCKDCVKSTNKKIEYKDDLNDYFYSDSD